ncbi:hypothetical protein GGX14DRAFT_557077 [Mycena pura]|uniref:Uncharacterized protein n=1 Tax=Mycena pura TaxID=153505 RepID=A0AAD6YMT8_9AGAR|nr:hypothetical protein GGX14DRAFT_557077 [Mycena pura]
MADVASSTGTSARRPSWFLDSMSSSAKTSPEQGHDSQKTTGQPLLIQQPFDNLFANSAGYALAPRGPYQWLTAHWAEISAKAHAISVTLSTSILQDTPAQPEGLEAVIRVVGPRTRNVAAFALHLAQRSGFSVQIGWAVRAKKQGVSTRAGNTYDGGSSLNGGGDERHPNGGGDDHPNRGGGGGEDEDCSNGRNDDGRGGNDRRRDGVGWGRRGEGEDGNDDGHGGNDRRRDRGGRGEGEGGTDGQAIDEQRIYTSQILWGQEKAVEQQFISEVILESDQTLPQPPKKTNLKLTINFSDSPQLQIHKGYLFLPSHPLSPSPFVTQTCSMARGVAGLKCMMMLRRADLVLSWSRDPFPVASHHDDTNRLQARWPRWIERDAGELEGLQHPPRITPIDLAMPRATSFAASLYIVALRCPVRLPVRRPSPLAPSRVHCLTLPPAATLLQAFAHGWLSVHAAAFKPPPPHTCPPPRTCVHAPTSTHPPPRPRFHAPAFTPPASTHLRPRRRFHLPPSTRPPPRTCVNVAASTYLRPCPHFHAPALTPPPPRTCINAPASTPPRPRTCVHAVASTHLRPRRRLHAPPCTPPPPTACVQAAASTHLRLRHRLQSRVFTPPPSLSHPQDQCSSDMKLAAL